MAIAHDLTTPATTTTALSLTFSHTVTGSNTKLVVGVSSSDATQADRVVSLVTYHLDLLTKIDEQISAGNGTSTEAQWEMIAPASGANNIIVTWGGVVDNGKAFATSITGAAQVLNEANNKAQGNGNSPMTVNLVTVNANAWIIDISGMTGTKTLTSAGSQVQRGADTTIPSACVSTLPVVSPGSTAITTSWVSNARDWGMVVSAHTPFVATSGTIPSSSAQSKRRLLMGVGL